MTNRLLIQDVVEGLLDASPENRKYVYTLAKLNSFPWQSLGGYVKKYGVKVNEKISYFLCLTNVILTLYIIVVELDG